MKFQHTLDQPPPRGRRGAAASGAVIGLAALGLLIAFALVVESLLTPPDDPPVGAPIELPTSQWRPGEGGDTAKIIGTVARDADGCVALRSEQGSLLYALWPAGYTADVHDGTMRIRDEDGDVVAAEGDLVTAGGGYDHPDRPRPACIPVRSGQVASIQSEITVVG